MGNSPSLKLLLSDPGSNSDEGPRGQKLRWTRVGDKEKCSDWQLTREFYEV